jgi:proteic killer suppression protein
MIRTVVLSRRAQKDLRLLPRYIIEALNAWIEDVELDGLENVRKIPGYHDEPLRGVRAGQRSIRLSKAYRAIYVLKSDKSVKFVSVEEVNKYDY